MSTGKGEKKGKVGSSNEASSEHTHTLTLTLVSLMCADLSFKVAFRCAAAATAVEA